MTSKKYTEKPKQVSWKVRRSRIYPGLWAVVMDDIEFVVFTRKAEAESRRASLVRGNQRQPRRLL